MPTDHVLLYSPTHTINTCSFYKQTHELGGGGEQTHELGGGGARRVVLEEGEKVWYEGGRGLGRRRGHQCPVCNTIMLLMCTCYGLKLKQEVVFSYIA